MLVIIIIIIAAFVPIYFYVIKKKPHRYLIIGQYSKSTSNVSIAGG